MGRIDRLIDAARTGKDKEADTHTHTSKPNRTEQEDKTRQAG